MSLSGRIGASRSGLFEAFLEQDNEAIAATMETRKKNRKKSRMRLPVEGGLVHPGRIERPAAAPNAPQLRTRLNPRGHVTSCL
jgi:hypothetical protein